MSKKDDEIIRLKALNREQHNHRFGLEDDLKDMKKENDDLTKSNNVILAKLTEAGLLKIEFEKQKEMHSRIVKQLQSEIKKISEHKDTMILSVNITGAEDIDKTLNDAEKTMASRLEKKGLKNKYILLAKPDTIGIEIHR